MSLAILDPDDLPEPKPTSEHVALSDPEYWSIPNE